MNAALQAVAWCFWSWIVPISLQATVLILLVALVDRLLPRRAWPQLRAALWGAVMVKLVLPPWLASPWSVAASLGVSDGAAWSPSEVPGWAAWLPIAWLAGTAGLVAFGLVRTAGLRRRLGGEARSRVPDRVRAALDRAAALLRLRRLPRVAYTAGIGAPFTSGVLRPRFHLPPDLADGLTDEQLELVALHELAHVKRRDPATAGLCGLVQLVYWFHPLVWIAQARLSALRELCCDRTVTRALGGRAGAYRSTLLTVAARISGEAPRAGLAFIVPRRSLALRLELIEAAEGEKAWLVRALSASALIVMLLAAVPMGARGERAALAVAEWIDKPPGCLQLRALVFQRMAREAAGAERGQR